MDNGIIRVGGRLAHGYSMTDDQRFPLLVFHRSKLATLAINDAHKRTLHGGPTATVAEIRRQIWVTQAMKKASACINLMKCDTCFRFNSGPTQQLMGDLPSSRIEVPERAFSCVGRDFAGPLTFNIGTECQGLRSCVYMICFKGSSSRGSIIIDVRCDGGSPKTIHCKTRHPQSNRVRQRNQLRECKCVTSTNWKKWFGQGHNHTAVLNGSSFLLAHPTSADYGKQR